MNITQTKENSANESITKLTIYLITHKIKNPSAYGQKGKCVFMVCVILGYGINFTLAYIKYICSKKLTFLAYFCNIS